MIGGYDSRDTGPIYHRLIWCLDLNSLEWTKLAPMSVPRCYVGTSTLKGDILAAEFDRNVPLQGEFIVSVGGHDGTGRLNSVELYNPTTNR